MKEVFVGGKYCVPKTVFQDLEEIGIHVAEEDQYDQYFTAFDFVSFQVCKTSDFLFKDVVFHHIFVPATFSIHSIFPGHTTTKKFRSNRNSQKIMAYSFGKC